MLVYVVLYYILIIKNMEVFPIRKIIFLLFLVIFFVSVFFVPVIDCSSQNVSNSNEFIENLEINQNGFIWPIPGYTRLSSPFGKRTAPTGGASSFHYGCDIPAPQGTKLVALHDGVITFANFLGAGGYTITLSFDNFKVSYCHVDPNFIISVGDSIKQGQIIAFVGPKNVYGVSGNLYKDSNGNPTNGATTGCHLHLGFRVNEQYVNPLNFF